MFLSDGYDVLWCFLMNMGKESERHENIEKIQNHRAGLHHAGLLLDHMDGELPTRSLQSPDLAVPGKYSRLFVCRSYRWLSDQTRFEFVLRIHLNFLLSKHKPLEQIGTENRQTRSQYLLFLHDFRFYRRDASKFKEDFCLSWWNFLFDCSANPLENTKSHCINFPQNHDVDFD